MNKFNTLLESLKENMTNEESLQEFLHKRLAGAEKIQKAAASKGGYSTLTAIHFKAKFKPYKECIKHTNDTDWVQTRANECLEKLKNWKDMSQREFQSVMGELEAYGEVYIRETKPNSIKL
jgi:gas vesicle protein